MKEAMLTPYPWSPGGGVAARCEDAVVNPDPILDGLDPEQRAAAEAVNGPVVILAGAGTGKTRAITHRIAHAVATGQHDPRRSLAVTFTARAAGEMRGRLAELGTDVTARTFHATALAQLKHFWGRAVGGSMPQILPVKARHVAVAASSLGLATDSASVRDLASEIEWSKVSNLHSDQYVAAATLAGRVPPSSSTREQVAALIGAYDRALAAEGLMDFEDVLRLTVGVLDDSPPILEEVRTRYRWFTVDEFQDVNPLQMRLLQLWLGDRDDLCVVGDASQTIYTFAGATPTYLVGFREQWPQATEVRLVRSYRCSPQIVELANRVIAGGAEAPSRLVLRSEQPAGPVPRVNEYASEADEAAAVAADIAGLIAGGMPPREIAILYRINAQSEPFEAALDARSIPSALQGSERFFERPEVKQGITLLRGAARADQVGAGVPLVEQVEGVLSSMSYTRERPPGTGAVTERWANLNRLVTLASDLVAREGALENQPARADLSMLVAELDRRATAQHVPTAEAVTLLSLHAAKGQEWQAVFIVGLVEGSLPIVHATSAAGIEEERRLLYVGITRAREHLTLSWARSRQGGSWGGRSRSRFLDELPAAGAASTALVVPGGQPRGERRRSGPAKCRVCGKSLVTPPERTMGRCRACPADVDDALFDRLRAWRADEAKRRSVPAFVVFTDATLMALAERRPTDSDGLRLIPGIGKQKLDDYGATLLALMHGEVQT
ncbi:unannotated protein [freshwater metagenome]|uniref:DNA 3'-5' helicase n=1 Tax=freshwater metagenome TaxID=449393 RepID=A0A6J7L2K6_9ZZZZ